MVDQLGAGLFVHALRAAREGSTATAWINSLRATGQGVRRQVGLRLFAEAKALQSESGDVAGRPLNAAPAAGELKSWPTQGAEGVIQTVKLFYRENVTGRIVHQYYGVKSERGMIRQEAVNTAIDAYASAAERYRQRLEGAVLTSEARLVPVSVT